MVSGEKTKFSPLKVCIVCANDRGLIDTIYIGDTRLCNIHVNM